MTVGPIQRMSTASLKELRAECVKGSAALQSLDDDDDDDDDAARLDMQRLNMRIQAIDEELKRRQQ